jgi:hypothetical protein
MLPRSSHRFPFFDLWVQGAYPAHNSKAFKAASSDN